MGNIALKENAELNLDMEAMTEETEGHCDEWNTRYKQLLENEKYFEEKRKEYDQELEKIKLLRASFEAYGMVKVTDSAAVTDSTGLALAATEKNALIPGTLGNKLAQLNTDSLKKFPELGENYIMNASDFADVGLYHIGSLSTADEKNYPHQNNPGDYSVLCVNNNPGFQVFLLFSPRLERSFYLGLFWGNAFVGWFLFSGT